MLGVQTSLKVCSSAITAELSKKFYKSLLTALLFPFQLLILSQGWSVQVWVWVGLLGASLLWGHSENHCLHRSGGFSNEVPSITQEGRRLWLEWQHLRALGLGAVFSRPARLLQGPASASDLGSGQMYILGPQHHGVCCPPPGYRVCASVMKCPAVQGVSQNQGTGPSRNLTPSRL